MNTAAGANIGGTRYQPGTKLERKHLKKQKDKKAKEAQQKKNQRDKEDRMHQRLAAKGKMIDPVRFLRVFSFTFPSRLLHAYGYPFDLRRPGRWLT